MNPTEQKCIDDIAVFGCHVIHVLEDAEGPPFSYSVGVKQSSGVPEVIIIGLMREVAHFVVNEYNSRVRSGEKFEVGRRYSGFLDGFDVVFEAVDKSHYRQYVGWDLWLYGGDEFQLWQVVYPTTTGVWPRDASASEAFKARQPLLGSTADGIACQPGVAAAAAEPARLNAHS